MSQVEACGNILLRRREIAAVRAFHSLPNHMVRAPPPSSKQPPKTSHHHHQQQQQQHQQGERRQLAIK